MISPEAVSKEEVEMLQDLILTATNENWEHALAQFQQQRKPNADAIADLALYNFIETMDPSSQSAGHNVRCVFHHTKSFFCVFGSLRIHSNQASTPAALSMTCSIVLLLLLLLLMHVLNFVIERVNISTYAKFQILHKLHLHMYSNSFSLSN